MSGLSRRCGGVGREDGSAIILTAIAMTALLAFLTFGLDVGNWFLHKRHLQMQADAAALATGQEFSAACGSATQNDQRIIDRAKQYAGFASPSGPSYNPQVAGRQDSVHIAINSSTWYGQSKTDPTVDTRPPCQSAMVDVKLTETDLPFLIKLINGVVPGNVVPAINAHARISVRKLTARSGFLPFAVPQASPSRVRATFINETTGATLGQVELTQTGTSPGGLGLWDNAAAPATITIPTTTERVGVRIALGEASSVTCGDPLVTCFDAGSANGLLHARASPTGGTATVTSNPIARGLSVLPGTGACANPTFVYSTAACSVGLRATVDFGTTTPVTTRGALVTANAGGTDFALTYDSGTQTWVSTAGASIPAGVGPRDVTLMWEVRSGTAGGLTCSNGGSNPCKGSFGVLQRVMSAQVARSGPIQLAGLDTTTATNANSFPQGSTQSLIVRIGVGGSLGNAASVSDPIVTLRVTGGGSQNQTVDCDPNQSNIRDEIANGCTALYKKNLGTTCPASVSTLWASAQPWDCIAIQTGAATGQVRQGLQDRLQGGSTSCVNANKWSQFPNLAPSDPRLVPLLLTPFNTFQGSGSSTVPVTGLGTFYITGYDGSPCSGDDAAGGGNIVGHFVKYVNGFADDTTTGTDPCVFGAFDPCYAQMTE